MAEEHKVEETVNQQENKVVAPRPVLMRSADILGFKVPYWVLIALVLIFIYYLYHRGAFKGLMHHRQNVTIADKTVLMQQTGVTDGIHTPEVVRRLLNRYN